MEFGILLSVWRHSNCNQIGGIEFMVTNPQELKDKLSIIEKESDFLSMIPGKPKRPSIILLVMSVIWIFACVMMFMSGEYWYFFSISFFFLLLILEYRNRKQLYEACMCASEIIEFYKSSEKSD